MYTHKPRLSILLFILFFPFLSIYGQGNDDPSIVYLTWQHKPDTTMIVHWITPKEQTKDTISYRRLEEKHWNQAKGFHMALPADDIPYIIHKVELTQLRPNTNYTFKIGSKGSEFYFRTLPETLKHAVRFIVGGDFYNKSLEILEETNKEAAKWNPQFVVLGGDLAYASPKDANKQDDWPRWLDFLTSWTKTMVNEDGFLIPMLALLGNHDVRGHFDQTPSHAAFFHALFLMPEEKAYRVMDFGDYMSIWMLDTNFTHPVGGEQTLWLSATLETRREVPNKFAVYHVPAYPSVRSFHNKVSMSIRQFWVPLFEKYRLLVAFENHDHAYKRTHLIRNNKTDPSGVLYMGDGAWGVNIRVPSTPKDRPYLAKSISTRNFIVVNITPKENRYVAVNDRGEVIDEVLQEHQEHPILPLKQ